MVSKLILGTLAAVGVGAGFALAGPPRSHAPTLASAVEVEQLYHNEVALNAQESHLQQLLGFARAELSRPAAPAPAARTSTAGGADRVARAPSSLPACHPPRSTSASPPVAGASPPPSTTTTTAPPPTTTTTATTTHDHDDGTTTHDNDDDHDQPPGDDGGGSDD